MNDEGVRDQLIRKNGCSLVVPRLLADFVGVHSIDPPGLSDCVVEFNHVIRRCVPLGDLTCYVPFVPVSVVSSVKIRSLIREHASERGISLVAAALEVASTFDWLAWSVLMRHARWRPTKYEQDPVWHRLIDQSYYGELIEYIGRCVAPYNGLNSGIVLDHVVEHDVTDGALRPADELAVIRAYWPSLAQFMTGRRLAECESAVRLAG